MISNDDIEHFESDNEEVLSSPPKERNIFDILGIPEYEERIFNSNSRGELFYLLYYSYAAADVEAGKVTQEEFKTAFKKAVAFAEENWERPESVFQHMDKMI